MLCNYARCSGSMFSRIRRGRRREDEDPGNSPTIGRNLFPELFSTPMLSVLLLPLAFLRHAL